MTPTSFPSWSAHGLTAVLRDALPEHELLSIEVHETLAGDRPVALIDDLDAAPSRQARIERMGQRLKQLVQMADAPTASAVAA